MLHTPIQQRKATPPQQPSDVGRGQEFKHESTRCTRTPDEHTPSPTSPARTPLQKRHTHDNNSDMKYTAVVTSHDRRHVVTIDNGETRKRATTAFPHQPQDYSATTQRGSPNFKSRYQAKHRRRFVSPEH